ncbi:MAG TPA: 50S ribosomal protein L3 [Armatimonadetes bacterium]|nr:50S ribosomal protein L3 [Armatimonadota bacterium]
MSGEGVAATVLEAGPCIVVQHRTKERDGYEALQLGFGKVKPQRVKKPQVGHFKRAGLKPEQYCRHLREIRDASPETAAVGEELKVDIFQVGERVNVRGTTKGRGFAGVMKRWGFHGHKASHGAKIHRTPASAGATDAARVFPGKKSPGHMGNARHTVRNLEVLMVDPEHNLLVVKGAVPGPRGGLVVITAEA